MHVLVVVEIIIEGTLVKSPPITVRISIILISNVVVVGEMAVKDNMSSPITTCDMIANRFTEVL